MAWATLSIPPFSRKFARLGHRFDELSKRDRFLRTGTKFLISIPAYPYGLLWVISRHFAVQNAMSALPPIAVPQKEVKAAAEGAGISWPSVRKAKERLGVTAVRELVGASGAGRWLWSLPARPTQDPQGAQGAHFSNVGTLHQNGHFSGEGEHLAKRAGTVAYGALVPAWHQCPAPPAPSSAAAPALQPTACLQHYWRAMDWPPRVPSTKHAGRTLAEPCTPNGGSFFRT